MPSTPSPVRIVHVIARDDRGGVETAAHAMARRHDLECDFRLIFIEGETLEPECPRIGTPGRAMSHPMAQVAAVRAILAARPDVLICSLWRSIPVALAAKLLCPRIRLVAFIHSARRVHWLDSALHWLLVRSADALWADSAASLAVTRGRPSQQRRIISFLTERMRPAALAPSVRPLFVSWSRLHPHKGLDRAVRLIHTLHARGIPARFDCWGPDQGDGPRIAALSARLGLEAHVRLRGPLIREQLPTIAAASCFYLQTSLFEGFGMSVAEAMQLGLVPVVTSVGEIGRYAADGVNALLVDPADFDAAAARLGSLLADQAGFSAMRTAAIETFAGTPLYPDQMCEAAIGLLGPRP